MKIQLFSNGIKNSITSTYSRIRRASSEGYAIASRNAKIYKYSSVKKYYNIVKSVGGKIIKNTTADELPYLGGAIGMLIPFPLISPILMGLGFLAKYIVKSISAIRNRF